MRKMLKVRKFEYLSRREQVLAVILSILVSLYIAFVVLTPGGWLWILTAIIIGLGCGSIRTSALCWLDDKRKYAALAAKESQDEGPKD